MCPFAVTTVAQEVLFVQKQVVTNNKLLVYGKHASLETKIAEASRETKLEYSDVPLPECETIRGRQRLETKASARNHATRVYDVVVYLLMLLLQKLTNQIPQFVLSLPSSRDHALSIRWLPRNGYEIDAITIASAIG